MGHLGKWTALLLVATAGCVHQLRDAAPPEVPLDVQAALAMPRPAKNRVHVVFVGPAVDLAGLGHLRSELIALGFIKTYAGCVGQKAGFVAAFEVTKRRESDARFAIVGQGGGANLAGDLAAHLIADGAAVDVLLYLDPAGTPPTPPTRVVCLSTGSAVLEGAENLKLDAHALGAAKHPATRAVLVRELVEVASRVPVMDSEPSMPGAVRGEWDFLKSAGPCPAAPCGKPFEEAAQTPAG